MLPALLLALVVQTPAPAGEPTLDEVHAAVDAYFADDGSAPAAHERLRAWGDAALPHLRTLAGQPSGLPAVTPLQLFSMLDDWQLVCAIDEVGTEGAIELLLDIAEAKTGVSPEHGLDQLEMGAAWKYKQRLKGDSRFQAIVLRSTLARGPLSGLQRASAARTIAALGWVDAAEVVEAMVQDRDLNVAEAAAAALFELTGREVEVPRPPLRFPTWSEGQAPLSSPREAPLSRPMRARFGFWRDGRRGLLIADEHSLSLIGPNGRQAARWETTETVGTLLSYRLSSGEGRWVVGTPAGEHPGEVSVIVASDWEGSPLWRFEPRRAGEVSMAVLYDEAGAFGVALSPDGREGLVAFDDAGRREFSSPTDSGGTLRSHPALPGRLLAFDGDTQLLDSTGKPTALNKLGLSLQPRGELFFTRHAALFPDREGLPAIVASGSAGLSRSPVIVRLDHDLAELWRATVPGDISGLAMLEPEDGPRLFAAACETGELYVFDENGAAYEPIRLVERMTPGEHMWVYAMDAGPFDDGSWGLAIALVDRTLLFVLEVGATSRRAAPSGR